MTKRTRSLRVNVVEWARRTLESETCQSVIDTKPFTGRGTAQSLRHHLMQVDQVEADMVALCAATKKVAGYSMYLAEHRRKADGYMALRWREIGTRKHLSWEEAHSRYAVLPTVLRQWYEHANAQAQEFNSQHLKLRGLVRELKLLSQQRKVPTFARPIPSRSGT